MNAGANWIADRCSSFDSSGIRKVFELAAKMKNPINLSIGQPDFDVPEPVKKACIDAIQQGKNAYSLTQGIAPLREKLQQRVDKRFGRSIFVTSGTSGGLVLTISPTSLLESSAASERKIALPEALAFMVISTKSRSVAPSSVRLFANAPISFTTPASVVE